MKFNIYVLLITILFNQISIAQCFEPDASIWEDTWSSCEKTPNPKTAYGNTHWIQFDLGITRVLSKTWVWNTNEPNRLEQGFDLVKIDHSLDGENWTYWGEMNFPKAIGTAVYGGFAGPDLMNIEARYVLVTVINNHGDPKCSGLAEMKFNLLPNLEEIVPPNQDDCAMVEDFMVEEVYEDEAFIFWELDTEVEDLYFLFQFRPEGEDEWTEIQVNEPEIFLESLAPNTTYEFQIGIMCEEEWVYTEIASFTTYEEEDCGYFEEFFIEDVWDSGAFIYWYFEGEADYFIVEYMSDDEVTMSVEVNESEALLEDLASDKSYTFIIIAFCGDEEIISETGSFFTHEAMMTNVQYHTQTHAKAKIFPNPNRGQFTLSLSSSKRDTLDYHITSIDGKVLAQNVIEIAKGMNTWSLNLSGLSDGVYFLQGKMKNSQGEVSERIVIIR